MFLRNGQCGKLWCDGQGTITPKDHGYSFYKTHATLNGKKINCR